MPKGLVIGAIVVVVVLIAVMSWLNNRSLDQTNEPETVAATPSPNQAAPKPGATQPAAPVAQGPVVLTATAPVWLQVSEQGGTTLFSGMLQPGQTYVVPASASAPVLKTGKPEALKVTVGNAVAPPVGPTATTISNVSLLAADLMKGPAVQAPAPPTPAVGAPPAPKPRAPTGRPVQTPPPPTATETPPTTNIGE